MYRIFFLALIALVCSCEKKYQISGRVFKDCAQTEPYANVELEFLRNFNRGTYAGKEVVATVKTDNQGRFYADFKMIKKLLYLNHFGYSEGAPYDHHEHEFRLEKGANDLGNIVLNDQIPFKLNVDFSQQYSTQDTLFVYVNGFYDTIAGPFVTDFSSISTFSVGDYHPDNGGKAKAIVTLSEGGLKTEQEMSLSYKKCQDDTLIFDFNF